MGRYKSILKAEQDARELPFTVDIPVPGGGLGPRMDQYSNWLGVNAKGYWAQHGKLVERRHVARYYFSSPWDAKNFEAWLEEEGVL